MLALTLLACRIIDDVELQDRLADLDLDGFQSWTEGGADCDDEDPAVNPAAEEVCGDGVDQDCDGGAGACREVGDVALSGALAAWGGPEAGDYLGSRVAFLGGEAASVVLAAPLSDEVHVDGGVVWVFDRVVADRALSGADARLVGPGAGAGFGNALAEAGDVDGDGALDLLVGASLLDDGGDDAGGAWLFRGPLVGDRTADTADWRVVGPAAGASAGFALTGLGDLDGDGAAEVAVAAGGLGGGEVGIFGGALGGQGTFADARLRIVGAGDAEGLGGSLAAADVDGDGIAELWAGAHPTGGYAGAAWLLETAGRGTLTTDDAVAEVRGVEAGAIFGYRVGAPGDVDGDGYADLAAGAPRAGDEDAGEVRLFLGPLAGAWTAEDADATWIGEPGDGLGSSLAAAGDVDGDGWPDLLVGAAGGAVGPSVPGAALLAYGPLLRAWPDTLRLLGDAAGDATAWDVAAGADATGDGVPDLLVGAYAADASAGSAWLWAGAGL